MIKNEGGILIHTMSYTIINYSCETDVFNLITFFITFAAQLFYT